ncbi:MAG: hypothetical protein ACREPY_13715 [Rhodanobacteraceae bacterium]
MNTICNAVLLAACLTTGTAWAQDAGKTLNLQLPPTDMPVAASTAASHPTVDSHGYPTSAPGVYYGDTSGRGGNVAQHVAAQRCDDSTYNQPQTHGSVSMGVMGGNHVSGNYQAGTFSVTKNLGDCEHPGGAVGFSISVGQSRFHGHGW